MDNVVNVRFVLGYGLRWCTPDVLGRALYFGDDEDARDEDRNSSWNMLDAIDKAHGRKRITYHCRGRKQKSCEVVQGIQAQESQ